MSTPARGVRSCAGHCGPRLTLTVGFGRRRGRQVGTFAAAMALVLASGCGAPHVRDADNGEGEPEQFRIVPIASTGSCGVERWSVKVATDPDASKINQTPQATTIEAMGALPKPASLPDNARVAPTETQ